MNHLLTFATCVTMLSQAAAQTSVSTDFETQPVGTAYVRSVWQSDGFTTDSWDNGLSDRTTVDDACAVSGTRSLKVTYPQGQFGTANTGCQVPLLFTPQDEYYMSYYLRFSDNFSWGTTSEGGKLPGLAGGERCSGGSSCDGTNGFSARFMWRTGGKAVLYLYHMDKPETYGEDHDLLYPGGDNVVFERGVWYHMMERVKINTDGSTYDGEVEVWVNGLPVLMLDGLRFTANGDRVDNLYISTFHGGSSTAWAPTETCHVWFDDFKVSTQKQDVEFLSCSGPDAGANRSLCGTDSVQLDAGIDHPQTTYLWVKDGGEVGNSSAIYVTEPGDYVIVYDSAGCVRRDTVSVFNTLQPDLGSDFELCTHSFETLHANDQGPNHHYIWHKSGEELAGEEGPTLQISQAGTYAVTVSAAGCASATDEVTVTSGLLEVARASGCQDETLTLQVNGSSTYQWFATEYDEAILATGHTFSFTMAGDTVFFVEDTEGFTGLVGKKKVDETNSRAWSDNRFDRRMVFSVAKNLSLDSITIYAATALDATIRILASDASTVVSAKTFTGLPAGKNRLALQVPLTAGDYFMDAVGTTGSLLHSNENDPDIAFPYSIDGLITLAGANQAWINAKPYYLFFYNWRVSTGNTCARTPVVVVQDTNCTVEIRQTAPRQLAFYPNPAQKTISFNQTVDEVKLFDVLGKVWTGGHEVSELDLQRQPSGIYFLYVRKGALAATFKLIKE